MENTKKCRLTGTLSGNDVAGFAAAFAKKSGGAEISKDAFVGELLALGLSHWHCDGPTKKPNPLPERPSPSQGGIDSQPPLSAAPGTTERAGLCVEPFADLRLFRSGALKITPPLDFAHVTFAWFLTLVPLFFPMLVLTVLHEFRAIMRTGAQRRTDLDSA